MQRIFFNYHSRFLSGGGHGLPIPKNIAATNSGYRHSNLDDSKWNT